MKDISIIRRNLFCATALSLVLSSLFACGHSADKPALLMVMVNHGSADHGTAMGRSRMIGHNDLVDGASLQSALDTLSDDQAVDIEEISAAYELDGTEVRDFNSKVAAAELMIRGGSEVVTITAAFNSDSHGDTKGGRMMTSGFEWDSHGDISGSRARALNTFSDRVHKSLGRNVVVKIVDDSSRSAPGSDHASAAPVSRSLDGSDHGSSLGG